MRRFIPHLTLTQAGIIIGLGIAVLGALSLVVPPKAPRLSFDAVPWVSVEGREIYVARYEVTQAEWNQCAADGACGFVQPVVPDLDPALTPATNISWLDAQDYVAWAAHAARLPLRLPTDMEWQAMAAPVLPALPDPIFTDPQLSWAANYLMLPSYPRALRAQGSFAQSPAGIHDLDGPVWEWTSDCYDGAAGANGCAAAVAGGLHQSVISVFTRDPARGGCAVGAPPAHLGLRLVSDRA